MLVAEAVSVMPVLRLGASATSRRPRPKFSLRTMIATGDPRKQARASLRPLAATRAACESARRDAPPLHIGR